MYILTPRKLPAGTTINEKEQPMAFSLSGQRDVRDGPCTYKRSRQDVSGIPS